MTAVQLDRTAPFELIEPTPISWMSDVTARTIIRRVPIPGLTKPGGGPVIVDVTYTLEEIEHDYVGVIVDYAYDTDLRYFGNHPQAEGPLRFLLPAAFPVDPWPKTKRHARDALRTFMSRKKITGTIHESDLRESKALYVVPPLEILDDENQLAEYFALLNEYLPFAADVAWSKWDGVSAIRVRPPNERI